MLARALSAKINYKKKNNNKTPIFIWRDKNVNNSYNRIVFGSNASDVYLATTTLQATGLINKYKYIYDVYVITNGGDNAEGFVKIIRQTIKLQTELVVFCSAVSYHKTWSSKYYNVTVLNGKINLQKWVNKIRQKYVNNISTTTYFQRALRLNMIVGDVDEKMNDNNNNIISSTNNNNNMRYNIKGNKIKYGLESDKFKISNKFDLKLSYKMKTEAIPDESGFNIVPITEKPVILMKLNLSYSAWNKNMENMFLLNLSKALGVNKNELSVLCKSQGSINLAVLVNAVINQYNGVPITCAYIENKTNSLKYSPYLQQYCIQAAEVKDWFNKKVKDNTINIMENINNMYPSIITNTLTKAEQWILNQTKTLKTALNLALNKLNDKYVVSAICLLDNDDAFNSFIQHSNIENSKLLFHGTHLSVLGSIYQTGLEPRGGSVYGKGSYLTSSPLHSINYMICYKSGVSSKHEYTLIAAYVNCGRIKQIYDMSYASKTIQYPYDSHYIAKVGSTTNSTYLGYPITTNYNGDTADEYAIKDLTRVLPRFYITLSKVDDKLNNYGANKSFIKTDNYHSSSRCFKHTVQHLSQPNCTQIYKSTGKYGGHTKNEKYFNPMKNLKIHPLLIRTSFYAYMFDTRGHEYEFQDIYHFIGSIKELKQKYVSPNGWTRYGLNVMNKYSNNKWLHPFNSNNNELWWRVFHGTINSKQKNNGNCIDAMANIYKNGFIRSETGAMGKGVYCSPDPNIIEEHGYCGIATICMHNGDNKTGTLKSFKFMLQCAVKPSMNTLSSKSNAVYWCVKNVNDIRAYGILIKEIPYEKQHDDYYKIPLGFGYCQYFIGGKVEKKIDDIMHGDVYYG